MGMTRERALEIERAVIYRQMNIMPVDNLNGTNAFDIGRVFGIMQKTLEDELAKEIDKEQEDGNDN